MVDVPETYEELIKAIKTLLPKRASMSKQEYKSAIQPILHMAKKYGTYGEVKKLLEEKDNKKFAFAIGATKDITHQLPLRNPKEVKAATNWLLANRDKLGYKMCKHAALQILKKSVNEVYITDEEKESLYKLAGLGIGNIDDIKKECLRRAEWLTKRGANTYAKKLMDLASALDGYDTEHFYVEGLGVKIAEELDRVDSITGMKNFYGKYFSRPEDVLFNVTKGELKKLEEDLIGNIKTGNYYKAEDMDRVRIDVLRDIMGEDFVKMATIGWIIDKYALNNWLKEASPEEAARFDSALQFCCILPYANKLPQS